MVIGKVCWYSKISYNWVDKGNTCHYLKALFPELLISQRQHEMLWEFIRAHKNLSWKEPKKKTRIGTIYTFKIHVDTILSAEGLALPDDNSRHDLLSEIRLTLLHSGHDHVSHTSWWKPVEAPLDALNWYDVQVLCPGVVSAVHRCCHWQTQRHAELVSSWTSTSCTRDKTIWKVLLMLIWA